MGRIKRHLSQRLGIIIYHIQFFSGLFDFLKLFDPFAFDNNTHGKN